MQIPESLRETKELTESRSTRELAKSLFAYMKQEGWVYYSSADSISIALARTRGSTSALPTNLRRLLAQYLDRRKFSPDLRLLSPDSEFDHAFDLAKEICVRATTEPFIVFPYIAERFASCRKAPSQVPKFDRCTLEGASAEAALVFVETLSKRGMSLSDLADEVVVCEEALGPRSIQYVALMGEGEELPSVFRIAFPQAAIDFSPWTQTEAVNWQALDYPDLRSRAVDIVEFLSDSKQASA